MISKQSALISSLKMVGFEDALPVNILLERGGGSVLCQGQAFPDCQAVIITLQNSSHCIINEGFKQSSSFNLSFK